MSTVRQFDRLTDEAGRKSWLLLALVSFFGSADVVDNIYGKMSLLENSPISL